MTRASLLRISLCLAVLAFVCAPSAKAQGIAGPCKDTWINAAYQWAYHRVPNGGLGANVTTGECSPALYGGGSWSSYGDLQTKMANSKTCPSNPLVGEAFYAVYTRQPSAVECQTNFGQWSGYSDLVNKIQAYKNRPAVVLRAPTAADLISDASGNLYDNLGRLIYNKGGYLIGENSSGIISQDGNGIISQDGNGLRLGDVIAGGAAGYHAMSLGKTVIKGTVHRK